jgi:Flp pilus assembly pilin Flp
MRAFRMFRQLVTQRDDRGAAMAEYGLLLAGIATVVAGAAVAFGGRLQGLYANFANLF